jgi:hypothetical protein
MITKFDTSASGGAPTTSKGGGSKILTWVLIAAAAYAGYRFVLKPYLDKRNKDNEQG